MYKLLALPATLIMASCMYADHDSDAKAALALAKAKRQASELQPTPTPVNPKTPSLRPDGLGYCSPACACSCQEGFPCTCGTNKPVNKSNVVPVAPYQPIQFYGSAGSCRSGG